MPSPSTTSTLTRVTDQVLIGLFIGLLWLPNLDTFFHFDRTAASNENRRIASFPKFQSGARGLAVYVAGLESYFNDHFGCRKWLVREHSKLSWSIFKEKNTSDVLVGKDGWLFYTSGNMIDHYSGQLQFTPEELHDWQVLLEKRRDWLAQRGIAYLFVVTPDKHTIYPEGLPDWLTKVSPRTKLDQFVAYMRDHSTVPVLDVREVVYRAKQVFPTYYKTDCHWNPFGGFTAYQEVMRALAKQRPDLGDPLPLASFTVTNRIGTGNYDMARMLGVSMIESNAFSLIPKPELPSFTTKWPTQPSSTEPRSTYNPAAKGRLLVFQDSFALAWLQFLGYHFNQVSFLWRYDFDTARIESEKPDIVISEINERCINIQNPRQLMAKEALR
jgi:alginate O-acetyltransferase complex protein AlgJ